MAVPIGVMLSPVAYVFLLPPAVGMVRARARGELVQSSLSTALGHPVEVQVAEDYGELRRRTLAGEHWDEAFVEGEDPGDPALTGVLLAR